MKKLLYIGILLTFLFIMPINIFAQPTIPKGLKEMSPAGIIYHKDQTIYWVSTSENVPIAWDAGAGAAGYELSVHWIRGDSTVQVYPAQLTTALTMTLKMPRAGIFVIFVRSYAPDPADNTKKIYSTDWAKSNDPAYATVDGVAKAWIIIASLPAPGPIVP